jgi:hypothetical protein
MSDGNITRRRVLEVLTVGGLTVTIIIPSSWIKPIIESIVIPAHAQASPAKTPLRAATSTPSPSPTITATPTITPAITRTPPP